jgi:hypothetical protein
LLIKKLYTNMLRCFHKNKQIPQKLIQGHRNPLDVKNFKNNHRLYRSFQLKDIDSDGNVSIATIKFPDLSCNWSTLSSPTDIWYKPNGSINDGCYSFSVKDSKFKDLATPVHFPLSKNYSHTEVRAIKETASVDEKINPPQKNNMSKTKKLEYRAHICGHLKIHLTAQNNN